MKIALPYLLLLITNSVLSQDGKIVNQLDTANVAVLPAGQYVFNKPGISLSEEEILLAEEIIKEAFSDHKIPFNGSLDCNNFSVVPLYKRQYFPTVENGEKLVYINCFIDRKTSFHFGENMLLLFLTGAVSLTLLLISPKKSTVIFR
jgi:hypothetical protein